MAIATVSTFEILSAALADGAFVTGNTGSETIAPEEILRFLARLRKAS